MKNIVFLLIIAHVWSKGCVDANPRIPAARDELSVKNELLTEETNRLRREASNLADTSFLPSVSAINTRTSSGVSRKRTGKFFGITSGALGNNLQLGLSFIVPFLNIPIGGTATTSSSYYGSYGTNTDASATYGTSSSLLGLNSNSVILALIIGLGAVILIPLFIYSFTGVSTSPYGRSDDVQSILTNLAAQVDDALQSQYNIDAPSCLQRAICTHISTSAKHIADGSAGSLEKIVDGIATNTYLNTFLSGTKIQEAMLAGRKAGDTCNKYMLKCPYSINSINRSLAAYAEDYIMKQGNDDEEFNQPDSSNDVDYE